MQLAVVGPDQLLDALDLCVLVGQKLCQVEEAGAVLGLVVVAKLNLTGEGGRGGGERREEGGGRGVTEGGRALEDD